MVGAVHPCRLHAGVECAQCVEGRVVADVKHVPGRDVDRAGRGVEDARIGLAHAELARRDRGAKELRDPHARQVRVAVGDGHQGKARRQVFERGPCIVEQVHALALREENLEGFLGKQGVFARAIQREPDRLAPHGAQVVFELGLVARHVVADFDTFVGE